MIELESLKQAWQQIEAWIDDGIPVKNIRLVKGHNVPFITKTVIKIQEEL